MHEARTWSNYQLYCECTSKCHRKRKYIQNCLYSDTIVMPNCEAQVLYTYWTPNWTTNLCLQKGIRADTAPTVDAHHPLTQYTTTRHESSKLNKTPHHPLTQHTTTRHDSSKLNKTTYISRQRPPPG